GIRYYTGVVSALYASVLGLTSPGDDVLTVTPIYPPFLSAIADQGRTPRLAPPAPTPSRYHLDFTALETALTPTTRLLLFCNPHNPTGRVWTRAELSQLADFATRHNLTI